MLSLLIAPDAPHDEPTDERERRNESRRADQEENRSHLEGAHDHPLWSRKRGLPFKISTQMTLA